MVYGIILDDNPVSYVLCILCRLSALKTMTVWQRDWLLKLMLTLCYCYQMLMESIQVLLGLMELGFCLHIAPIQTPPVLYLVGNLESVSVAWTPR